MVEESDSRHCLVCTVPIASATHLGLETCRACAAFFKRVKAAGSQYLCRTGQRNCIAIRNSKFACRRCRFDKCVAIGMDYDGLLRERRKPKPSILEKIKNEYRVYFERRRAGELKLIRSHGGHNRIPHPTEELYDVQDTCYKIFRIAIPEANTFFRNLFPEFSVLCHKEQDLIARDYTVKMSFVEGFYRTQQIWGEVKRYMMWSTLTCHDLEREYEGIDKIENASSMISFMKNFTNEQNAVYLPTFNRSSLTEYEFYALMAMVIGDVDSTLDLSEQALAIVDLYRREVLEDLQEYYQTELGLRDFAVRLGNLMSINHAAQECQSLFNVFFRFHATIFDVFVNDKKFNEFFL